MNTKNFKAIVIAVFIGASLPYYGYAQKIILPFQESKYKTDAQYLRAMGTGKDNNMQTARKIAMLNARAEIASSMEGLLETVGTKFAKQNFPGNPLEFQEVFEQTTHFQVSQILKGSQVMQDGEQAEKNNDGSITYYVVIEMPTKAILNPILNEVFTDKKTADLYEQETPALTETQTTPISRPKQEEQIQPQTDTTDECKKITDIKKRIDCQKKNFEKIFNTEINKLPKKE